MILNQPFPLSATDERLYRDLCHHLTEQELQAVQSVADDLLGRLGDASGLPQRCVMVAYGGGKDSSYTVAFIRAVQLYVQGRLGVTFRLRVANMRHGGVPFAVMRNIHRVYDRLGLLDDERVELLLVDHDEVTLFDRDRPLPERVRTINQTDILMNGHRTRGDGRPTFCNSCNLSVASFYGLACWWQGGADIVITGDSRKEQKQYYGWIMGLGKKYGIDTGTAMEQGFHGLLNVLSQLGQRYYEDLYGAERAEVVTSRRVHAGHAAKAPEFMTIYDHVSYCVDDHWELIVDFLGFEFDDLAFSFTESDCANPSLMAHIRGLKTQYVEKRTYAEGIREYLVLAEQLMKDKEIPPALIAQVMARYADDDKIRQRGQLVADYANKALGLNDQHLVCMVYSPFVNRGERLAEYFTNVQPEWLPHLAACHELLSGGTPANAFALRQNLTALSGLELENLRQLYRRQLVNFSGDDSLIAAIRQDDPHKGFVPSKHLETGEQILELISGR